MANLDSFTRAAGQWRATYKLRDPGNTLSDDSDSTAVVTSVLDGRFVRVDYSWAFKGTPHEGSLLVGCQDDGTVTVPWVDSFHNGRNIMVSTGRITSTGDIDVRGSYEVPGHPAWGWRTVLSATDRALSIVMYNVTPDGEEHLAVDAQYRRA
jgi:hypothetical protein